MQESALELSDTVRHANRNHTGFKLDRKPGHQNVHMNAYRRSPAVTCAIGPDG